MGTRLRLIDIGANLVDEMYSGIYNGSKKHEPDILNVLNRAYGKGVEKIFVTAGNLEEAEKAAQLVTEYSPKDGGTGALPQLWSTIGVHPTRCDEFLKKFPSPEAYFEKLRNLYSTHSERIVAIGELGLDFDRTNFCSIDIQKRFFALQLSHLSTHFKLPMFLHCRGPGAVQALTDILRAHPHSLKYGGVVHSFDGNAEDMRTILSLDLHIGINGCSLKTQENCTVVKLIPVNRLMLETDSPWCGIRPSHESFQHIKTKMESSKKQWSDSTMYKQRNEPQTLLNILEIVAALKEIPESELSEAVYRNTMKLFWPKEVIVAENTGLLN